MKVFATYLDPTGYVFELAAGELLVGPPRVRVSLSLPMRGDVKGSALKSAAIYLTRGDAIDLADALKRAAQGLP